MVVDYQAHTVSYHRTLWRYYYTFFICLGLSPMIYSQVYLKHFLRFIRNSIEKFSGVSLGYLLVFEESACLPSWFTPGILGVLFKKYFKKKSCRNSYKNFQKQIFIKSSNIQPHFQTGYLLEFCVFFLNSKIKKMFLYRALGHIKSFTRLFHF